MKVNDVMTKKVITVQESDSYADIVEVLVTKKISGAPVLSNKGKLKGIISEKDLILNLFPKEQEFYENMDYYVSPGRVETEAKKITKLKAKDLMTRQVISVHPDDSVMHACAVLIINNIRRLPVIDEGEIVGIVTTRNLYKRFLKSLV